MQRLMNKGDLTQGSVVKGLLLFALPIFLGQLLQQLYHLADAWVIGNFAGNNSFAAVSSGNALTWLIIGFFSGVSIGGGVIISRYFGAKEEENIEKAIQKSDLGINPSNDGRVVRLLVPELNEERRKELCKQVKKSAEEAKVAMRNIRRDAMEAFKKLKKDSKITEDDQKTAETQLQKAVDEAIKNVDAVSAEKEKEIMSI